MKTIINAIIFLLFFSNFYATAQFNAVEFIDKVQTFQNSVEIEYNRCTEKQQLVCFNLNEYMQMFNALRIKDSQYVFDCFYFSEEMSGMPFLYVRQPDFNLLSHLETSMNTPEGKQTKASLQQSIFYFLTNPANRACNNVIPEDTKEGYLQYIFFHEFGEQFALFWHAAYKRRTIVCSELELKEIAEQCADAGGSKEVSPDAEIPVEGCIKCDSIALNEMLKNGMHPTVKINGNHCLITLYEKNRGGIYKKTFRVMREDPYEITLKDEKEIASETVYGYIF